MSNATPPWWVGKPKDDLIKEIERLRERVERKNNVITQQGNCIDEQQQRIEELESKIAEFIHGENEGPKGYWITTEQINEAWAFVIDPPGYLSQDVKDAVEAALGAFGIERCPNPDCDGYEWRINEKR
jgi:hypothetical protein